MITTEVTKGSVTLVATEISGLTAETAPNFRQKVLELYDSGLNLLVIDLSGVRTVDSSGIGALVSLLKRIGLRGDLALCGLSESVMQMFRVTRMDRVFSIHADRGRAVAALGG